MAPAAWLWPQVAAAAPQAVAVSIAPKPYAEALIDLALQTHISLAGAELCRGDSPGLKGRFTPAEALTRLLAKAPCRFQMVDATTARILPPLPAAASPPQRAAAKPLPATSPESAAGPDPMSEIVVTATKRRATLGSTPAAISLIGGQRLRDNGSRHTSGIAGQVAGVVVTNLGPGRDKILLRGLSDGAFTGRTRSTVGTYLDDVPITYNAPDPDLRLTDVERIEVVRGPQGALYGAGSLAGVFRIVTKTPDLNRAEGSFDVSRATTQSGSSSASLDLIGNMPLADGKAAVRVVGYRALDGGYLDDINLRLSNVDRTVRSGGRGSLLVRPDENWTISLQGAAQYLESNDTQYTTMQRLTRANKVRESHKNNFGEATLSVTRAGEAVRLQSTTAFVRHDYSSFYDASAALSLFDSADADLGLYREGAKLSMLVQDIYLTRAHPGRLDWLLGAYGSQSLEKTPSVLRAVSGTANTPPAAVYSEDRSDRLLESALYGEVSYRLGERITASAGGRLFKTQLHTKSFVMVPSPGKPNSFEGKTRFTGLSPKFSLQYRLDGGGSIYALASQGYRAGGYNTAGRTPPTGVRRTYQPDRLENYEIGAKLTRLGGRLDLRTALFYVRWTDIQTDQYFSSGLSYTANVGDGRNTGIEGEIAYSPTPRVTLQANILANNPKVTRLDPLFAAKVQPGLPGIPDFSLGAEAHYRYPLRGDNALLVGGQLSYVGRSHLTFEPGSASAMGDITTARLSAQYVTPRWSLAFFLTNPTNAQGDTFAYGNPFSFGQVRQVTPQRPRTATLELSATF